MSNSPPNTDAATLDALILQVEQRLVERQARLRREVDGLGVRVRSALAPQRLAVPVAAGATLWLAWRWLGRRGNRPATSPRPRMGLVFWLTQLSAVVWPLLSPALRVRASPAGLVSMLGAAWPQLRAGFERPGSHPPQPVASVDLQRFAGTWYEVARLRNRFEDACSGQPSANYALHGDHIEVINRCPERGGGERVAQGVARVVRGSGGARWRVCFAPRWLHLLPFVWSNLWILHLEDDYSAALVGTPGRRNLWLLARQRALPQAVMLRLLDVAEREGFDLNQVLLSSTEQRRPLQCDAHAAAAAAAQAEPLDAR